MDLRRAVRLQEKLAARLVLEWRGGRIRRVAGADSGYDPDEKKIIAVIVVMAFPDLKIVEVARAVRPLKMPYVPGFLSFREGPAFLAAFRKLRSQPDVTFLDGNGIAHPRRMGLASHVGVLLDVPTIGCAKSAFFPFRLPSERRGAYTHFLNQDGEKVGFCLRTRAGVRPVFISPGHRVSLAMARRVALDCSHYRIPEPLREAHRLTREVRPRS